MSNTYLTIAGNVTAPPELKFGKTSGLPFTRFRVAVNSGRWDKEHGAYVQTHTSFIEVIAFGALGLNVYESVQKGNPVVVHGRLRVEDWDNGERRGTTVRIHADQIGFDMTFGQGSFTKVTRPAVPVADPMNDVNDTLGQAEEESQSSAPGGSWGSGQEYPAPEHPSGEFGDDLAGGADSAVGPEPEVHSSVA